MKLSHFISLLLMMNLIHLNDVYSQIRYGVKGGMNISNVKFKEIDNDQENLTSFHFGGVTQFMVTEKLFLEPELLYSHKGWTIPDDLMNKDVSLHLHYLNLPILFGYRFKQNISFFIGPELGYNFNTTRKDITGSQRIKIYEKLDVGILIGTSLQVYKNIGLDVRYIYGFHGLIRGETYDGDGNKIGSFANGSNRVFQLGLFYLFDQRK